MRPGLQLLTVLVAALVNLTHGEMSKCDVQGEAQRCMPSFVNAAYGRLVVASNTCGHQAEEYCLQTGRQGVTKSCHICDQSRERLSHDAKKLTDLSEEMNAEDGTWWQSNSMIYDVQYPNTVNLTLDLGKTFDITYVRLKFKSPRPESFAIYKKNCSTCDWQPWQYYSGSCFATYGIDNEEIVTADDEQKALCTDKYSDISPLTGGNIAFSTLEGRPSAYEFDQSLELQNWVKAVAIRISLDRLNTFGDEVFKDPEVLKSYFYAISDLSVGGRCSCNGHANHCYLSATEVLVCRCQHNTAGPDCDRCADGYNDLQWRAATRDDPAVCQKCECNGKSEKCEYDHDLFLTTGRGGRCLECADNTDGPNCQQCLPYHYRDQDSYCTACNCDQIGSKSQECNNEGQCMCKPGVGGKNCDQCLEGYYGLSEAGCTKCTCFDDGTVNGTTCDIETGQCDCKLNVEGLRCDKCKLGSMALRADNPYGCISCFCFGHSNVCQVSDGYTKSTIESDFFTDRDGWSGSAYGDDDMDMEYKRGDVSMSPDRYLMTYFVAPEKFLGDQQKSYGQMLSFDLKMREDEPSVASGSSGEDYSRPRPRLSRQDVVLQSKDHTVGITINAQGNPEPNYRWQTFKYMLHEANEFVPQISAFEFQKMLFELTALKIRSSYAQGTRVHLDNVRLETAVFGGDGEVADWVEECVQDGYAPGIMNSCQEGYTRDPPNGSVFDKCVPCSCNGHGDMCDPATGVCECMHNTVGDHCDMCAEGFYFNGDEKRRGTPQQCQPCPCPEKSGCALIEGSDEVVCVNCPEGYAGRQCEICQDGWFGEPRGRGPCQRCMCNGNVDENNVMNCNTTTGECLKCIHNTTGFHCDSCLEGYWGKPVTNNPDERCQPCECDAIGSRETDLCEPMTGNCDCKPFVIGQKCDQCQPGYWNLMSGDGCQACQCHPLGSDDEGKCDEDTGVCTCLPGVGGDKCDSCLDNHYGMDRDGCKSCDCDPDGSVSLQCGENGKCICKEGVLGLKCDMCQENYHNIKAGCVECPACYGLVQNSVDEHRIALAHLEEIVNEVGNQSISVGGDGSNKEFEDQLTALNGTVADLLERANENTERQGELRESIDKVSDELHKVFKKLSLIEADVDQCEEKIGKADDKNMQNTNHVNEVREALERANKKLEEAKFDLNAAKEIADQQKYKHENMTQLAELAEELAVRVVNESELASQTAQQALDNSLKAKNSIEEALDVLNNLLLKLSESEDAESKIPVARKLKEELEEQAVMIKEEAEKQKTESTNLFSAADKLKVPSVDTDTKDQHATEINAQIAEQVPEVEKLNKKFDEKYFQLSSSIEKADTMYQTMHANQQSVDQLLAKADAVEKSASMAVEKGNQTLTALKQRVETLKSFDYEIEQNRAKAEAELAKKDAIEATIEAAKNVTEQAKEKLGASKTVAVSAKNKALQALDIATGVEQEAERILATSEDGRVRAAGVQDSATDLKDQLAKIDEILKGAESKVDQDADELDTAIEASAAAEGMAKSTRTKVNNVLKKLEDLIASLDTLVPGDNEEMARLSDELTELENEFVEAGLGGKIAVLKEEVSSQKAMLDRYDAEIAALVLQVENLEHISATIPDTCSASQEVESE